MRGLTPKTPERLSAERLLKSPLFWVTTLYVAMGIPFNLVNGTASSMFKALGVSDAQNTLAVGNIIIAWSLKPLWAAFLDMFASKRFFVLATQAICAVLCISVAIALPGPHYFSIVIAILWIMAFASSTHDIAADGIYLTSLSKPAQAGLAGVMSMAWNLGKVIATGLLVSVLARTAVSHAWSPLQLWICVWLGAAALMTMMFLYHLVVLPRGVRVQKPSSLTEIWFGFNRTSASFFHKRKFWGMIAFVFLYRTGEGLLLTEGKLFLQSSIKSGGLGFSVDQVANIDAVYGTIAVVIGGILGGLFLSRLGLKRALPILALCLNIPHLTYIYLSQVGSMHHGLSFATVAVMVSIEKFGYGFGVVGNLVYLMQQLAPGRTTMTHYAFAAALMNLMLVPTTMISGPLAEGLGFSTFFLVVILASVPSVWAACTAPFPLEDFDVRPDGTVITSDDPTLLSSLQRRVQSLAGRASMYTVLHILLILMFDIGLVGHLQADANHTDHLSLVFLLVSAVAKLGLSLAAMASARQAMQASKDGLSAPYANNAKGAMTATWFAIACDIALLVFAWKLRT